MLSNDGWERQVTRREKRRVNWGKSPSASSTQSGNREKDEPIGNKG